MIVEFGQWTPDRPDLRTEGCIDARNVLPSQGGFTSFAGPATFGSVIPDPPVRGSFWLQDEQGVYYNFAATANQLYRMVGTTWTAVGQGSYAAGSTWRFVRFGNRVVAVAKGVAPQYYDLGVSSTFADLPGSPPTASAAAVIRDQIVLGATARSGSDIPAGLQAIEWSGVDQSEIWGPNIRYQADVESFFSRGGDVQAITPGEVGYIIREHSIHRMTFVGSPVAYRFDEIALGVGTPAPDSVCWLGQQVFFLGHDGFYVLAGGQLVNIGQNRVDGWFKDRCVDIEDVVGAVDRRARRVFWAFRSSSVSQYDKLLCYDIDLNAWSYADVSLDWLDEFSTPGLSLDELDSVLPGGIDATPFLVDSNQYTGGVIGIAGFTGTGQGVTFTGPPAIAELETHEFADENARSFIQGAHPIVEGTAAVVEGQIAARDRQNATANYGSYRGQATSGEIKFRESTRFARIRLRISGGFRHAIGVKIRFNTLGGRR